MTRIAGLLIGFLAFVSLARVDNSCIEWDLHKDVSINKRQVERLYEEASLWVEQNVSARHEHVRPCITIHVGLSCPDREIQGSCVSAATGDIYVPDWRPVSPATIAQGTISISLLRLVSSKQITAVADQLYGEDKKNFLDSDATPPPR
jgi:hypothetical protein